MNEQEKRMHRVYSDEGQYHIKSKYDEFLTRLKANEITSPMLRGRCVSETAHYLEGLY